MSSVILTNWTVYYADDAGAGNGMKQIKWTGTTGTNTVNQLYSAIADLFSIAAQNNADDTIPMRAVTPTLYEIGAFDSGDLEPWFIDPESIKHLTGGGLNTANWTRSFGGAGDIGIVKITRTGSTNIVAGDIGATISHDSSTDTGWLLHIDGDDLWIRPTTNATNDDWDQTSGTITCNSNTDTQLTAGVSGENIWTNIFTLGSIEDNSTIFISQSNSVISNTEASGSGRWWGDGHIDVLIKTTDQDSLTDRGLLTIFARQYSKKYGFFTSDASAGGRIPVPLATSDDLNNTTGYRTFTGSAGSGTFNVDNGIYVGGTWATATKRGIITSGGSGATPTLVYYLIGDLTDFAASDAVTEYDFATASDDATVTAGAPSNTGPASQAMTITFGLDETLDIDGDSVNEDYSIVIDLTSSITLATMNERLKYITRRGETATLDGIEGQQYIGIDYRVDYTSGDVTGTISDGDTVTQVLADGTTATSEVVAHDATDFYLMLRDTRGTLEVGAGAANLEVDGSNYLDMTDPSTATIVIAPVQEHPFGNFAGGRFFGARGVGLKDVPAADAQNYELIDNGGTRRVPPSSVPVSVTVQDNAGANLENAQVFIRKSADNYSYTSHNTLNVAGDATFEVNEVVDTDLPQTGWLHVYDSSTDTKQNYRYASWTGKIFTLLSEITGSATSTDGTDPNIKLISTSTNFLTADIEEGDAIRNTTTGAWAVVDEIVDADNITTTELSSGQWTSGDAFSFHRLAITYDNTDLVDIPILNAQTNASGVASLTYLGSVPISIIVRIRSNEDATKYVPFNTTGSITSSGFSLTAILTEDTVAT